MRMDHVLSEGVPWYATAKGGEADAEYVALKQTLQLSWCGTHPSCHVLLRAGQSEGQGLGALQIHVSESGSPCAVSLLQRET